MRKILKFALLAAGMLPMGAAAQITVDRTKYPDYNAVNNPDWSLMKREARPGVKTTKAATRPDHVNNAETMHFPPVFNQAGGSCGSASRICYMFTHELNSFRNLDGKDPNNYYPSHFVWLLTYGNSGKNEFVTKVGVPSAAVYGGQTYSKYFGYQDTENNNFGWMQGYDKWYSGMFNRMWEPVNFPVSVKSEEGREAVKNYLWNHNGDTDFHSGGIVGIGVASGGDWQPIPSTPTNDEIGLTGMRYVNKWGTQVDHALTIVGYDDRVEFDLNGNGVYGEESADEKGAWIIVNSWGSGWCNGGFVYCPYAYAVPAFTAAGKPVDSFYTPEVYHVRKNYRPLRTIKLLMDYSRRSELYLSAGVSQNLDATEPEMALVFDHFKYAGDGNYGNTVPAPEVPMLGLWADGKLHYEPMEFGYDLTDLTDNLDPNMPMKYFFMVDTKATAEGEGKIHGASIIDYAQDEDGVETPFELGADGVNIQNQGKRTIVSVVVQGRGFYAPQNAAYDNGSITWQAPIVSGLKITAYNIYKEGGLVASVKPNVFSYAVEAQAGDMYQVSAVYDKQESGKVSVYVPTTVTGNESLNFAKSGFSIPDVFGPKYEKATIEYWINCNSLANWNQSAGPGWGQFMFHANSDGRLTVGWNTGADRTDVSGAYTKGTWKHIAIVVDGNKISAYVNGQYKTGFTSQNYSGIGGFGALTFTNSTGNNSYLDAKIDEIRIWKTARTSQEIRQNYKQEFGDAGLPADLIAYFKGDLVNVDGELKMRDHTAGQHHAKLLDANYQKQSGGPSMSTPVALNVAIDEPAGDVYAGVPVTLKATASTSAQTMKWTVEDAGLDKVIATAPSVTFKTAGKQKVTVEAINKNGESVTAETEIDVKESPAPDAEFTATKTSVPAGDRVSFLVKNPRLGYSYNWDMPGADVEKVATTNAAASYQMQGTYKVTLTVTAPNGAKAVKSVDIAVSQVAPLASFNVEPGVVMKDEMTKLISTSKYGATDCKWQLVSPAHVYVGTGDKLAFHPAEPGVYDVKLIASNEAGSSEAVQEGGLVVCNADSKTGLNFAYANSNVALSKVPLEAGLKTFTIDWWMSLSQLAAMGNGMGDADANFYCTTNSNGNMNVQVKDKIVSSGAGYVLAGGWHHYALVMKNNYIYFYRDGKQFARVSAGRTVPELTKFVIGLDFAPMNGLIDEFRIWSNAIAESDFGKFFNAPLSAAEVAAAEKDHGLKVYYQFNQNGGNVKDETSNANTGVRSNFGPEGDSWSLSKGVFSLNFSEAKATDVTATTLKNYKAPFTTTGKTVNNSVSSRFYGLADWTLENVGNNGTGAHVDTKKDKYFTITTTWDSFDESLVNQKTYQTVKLPAGAYMFTANYGTYEGQANGTYLVAAEGAGLPDTDALDSAPTLGYTLMDEKSDANMSNTLFFIVTEETEVSIGVLSNLSGKNCMTVKSFSLMNYPCETIENDPAGISDAVLQQSKRGNAIYDLYGRRVLKPEKGGVYIIGGQKVILK